MGALSLSYKNYIPKFNVQARLSLHDIDNMSIAEKSFQDFMDDTYVINTPDSKKLSKLSNPLFVIKFAEYGGLLNKDNVPGLVSRLESRNDVDYILLNVDYTIKK